jgi:hypothetical protein
MLFCGDNLDTDLDEIEPKIEILANYFDTDYRAKFTKTPGEYVIEKNDGKWWVGYNLAIADISSEGRKYLSDRLKKQAQAVGKFYSNMDENMPYDGEEIIYRRVR